VPNLYKRSLISQALGGHIFVQMSALHTRLELAGSWPSLRSPGEHSLLSLRPELPEPPRTFTRRNRSSVCFTPVAPHCSNGSLALLLVLRVWEINPRRCLEVFWHRSPHGL
jgi:hypothetical protein